ncbi:15997_t:CDS:2 [Entrophospora sp. SA101]|nr:15997_t:CDS:2 [Entrophospora sp. SA101]CAJ0847432.1 17793_t:CDS:2 [Entrophospora sp. SA101]
MLSNSIKNNIKKKALLLRIMTLRRDPSSIIKKTSNETFKRVEQKKVKEPLTVEKEDLPKGYTTSWRNEETLPGWLKHRFAIKEKIGFQPWRPKKRLSREVMDKIRYMNQQLPEEYTIEKLSSTFRISPEAINRILKSTFVPKREVSERQETKYQEKLRKFKEKAKSEQLREKILLKERSENRFDVKRNRNISLYKNKEYK